MTPEREKQIVSIARIIRVALIGGGAEPALTGSLLLTAAMTFLQGTLGMSVEDIAKTIASEEVETMSNEEAQLIVNGVISALIGDVGEAKP